MKLLVGLVASSLATPVLADALTSDQMHALVDAVKESTRNLLRDCLSTENFVQCASNLGIRCENTAKEAAEDYRCVTQATMEFGKDLADPSDISETFKVTFRVFYAGERWNVGPDSISRVGS